MIVAGNGIYNHCGNCGKLVQVNKFLVGSLHLCCEAKEQCAECCRMFPRDKLMLPSPSWGPPLAERLYSPELYCARCFAAIDADFADFDKE